MLPLITGLAMATDPTAALTVTSQTFADGATIPTSAVYGKCGGSNRSPQLAWSGTPAGTKSFAIIAHDYDAPRAGGWNHWLVVDLPPSTTSLAENAGRAGGLPEGARHAQNDFGEQAYGGPCPPPGSPHHYQFTVYALDVSSLPVAPTSNKKQVEASLQGHILGSGTLTGLFGR